MRGLGLVSSKDRTVACHAYSRVPNKQAGRLLENEKKIPPIRTYSELYVY